MKTRTKAGRTAAVALAGMMAVSAAVSAPAGGLQPPGLGNVRIEGRVGEKLSRCLDSRVYSGWARGPSYDEAENAFRTHADDADGNTGWQNEYWGKTMLCVAGAVAYTKDAGLRAWALEKAHRFVADFQKPNGYLSTYANEDFLGGVTDGRSEWCFNIWGRKYTLWALIELHRVTGDKTCLDAAVKMADHLIAQLARLGKPIWATGAWNGISSMSILRPFNELYRLTGERRFLAFAAEIVRGLDGAAAGPGAILADARRADPIRSWHPEPGFWAKAYETMSCLEGVADYLKMADDGKVRGDLLGYVGHIEREEINPMRSAGHFDHFFGGGVTFNGMTELCDVVHWIRLNRELLLLTGEAKYADRLEEAFYNAFLAGVSRDGRWGAHVVRSHGTRHLWAPAQTGMTEHQCCPDNMMRTYFDVAGTLALEAPDGALDVVLYADGTTRLAVGEVSVRGGYPYADGPVVVNVNRKRPGKVRFRVPGWSARGFAVDGSPAKPVDGWYEVDGVAQRAFSLTFDRAPRIVDVPAAGERGSNGKSSTDDPAKYTQRWMTALTPEMEGLVRKEPAAYVMVGPLVLAKGRLAGTSREETLFATSIRGQGRCAGAEGWTARLERLTNDKAVSAGVADLWRLTLSRGATKVSSPVSDFASVSNVDDPANWFSLWF